MVHFLSDDINTRIATLQLHSDVSSRTGPALVSIYAPENTSRAAGFTGLYPNPSLIFTSVGSRKSSLTFITGLPVGGI